MITNMVSFAIIETAVSSMQCLVFVALAIGGVICLGAAALFGGHHDSDHDLGHGGHDSASHDSGHESAPSFLSPRVFFAFLVGFGVAGAIASICGFGSGAATGIGFIPGFIMAFIAWIAGYALFKQQADSSIKPRQVINCIGTVTCAIRPGKVGEVDVSVNRQLISYNARSEGGNETIDVGTRVRVTNEFGGQVTVKKETVA